MRELLKEYIQAIIAEKKEGDKSYMIALYPDSDSLDKILDFRNKLKEKHDFSNCKELSTNEMHATIRWWKAEQGGNLDQIKEKLKDLGKENSIICQCKGTEILGDSLSLMFKSPTMENLYSFIDRDIKDCGAPASIHESFIPHLALFYGDIEDKIKEKPNFSVRFNKLRLVDNDDRIIYQKMLKK